MPAYVIKKQPKIHFKHLSVRGDAVIRLKRLNFGDIRDSQNSNQD